jgi:hypothetical protein
MSLPEYPINYFTQEEIAAFEPMMKVGLVATITPEGLPHLTMLSTLKAVDEHSLSWGQFTEGTSFQNVLENPKVGWLVMTLQKDLWRGKGDFTHNTTAGPEFDWYNQVPMFRYNAYFGIHTVYYMNLAGHTGKVPLPMNRIILAAVKTMASKIFLPKSDHQVMNEWTRSIFNKLDNLKFLTYVNEDGYPVIIPVIQAQAAGTGHMIFATGAFTEELQTIPRDVPMTLFGLNLNMTDVVCRGAYQGLRWVGPHRCGVMEVDWVYSPMPPVAQQVYPPVPLEPVREF